MERSSNIGISPAIVVNDVSHTGRKRLRPASISEACSAIPLESLRLIKSTKTIESLTTTPVNATTPNRLNRVNDNPRTKCPNTAPTNPKGITHIIMSGCAYALNSSVSTTNITINATTNPTPKLWTDSVLFCCWPSQSTSN